MKIRVRSEFFDVLPKQSEGKIVAGHEQHEVKPKPAGVILQKEKYNSIFKTDRISGVIIKKQKFTKILKQWD